MRSYKRTNDLNLLVFFIRNRFDHKFSTRRKSGRCERVLLYWVGRKRDAFSIWKLVSENSCLQIYVCAGPITKAFLFFLLGSAALAKAFVVESAFWWLYFIFCSARKVAQCFIIVNAVYIPCCYWLLCSASKSCRFHCSLVPELLSVVFLGVLVHL